MGTALYGASSEESEETLSWEELDDLLADFDALLGSAGETSSAAADVSPFEWDMTVELGGGYESNPLLSTSDQPLGSGYQRTAFDGMLTGNLASGFLTGFAYYDRRQFLESGIDPEQIALVHLGWERPTSIATFGLESSYLFAEQVYDASTGTASTLNSGLFRQQVPAVAVSAERAWGEWNLRLEVPFAWSIFERAEDDYWEGGTRLELERRWNIWNRVGFFVEVQRLQYDSGLERDPRGFPLASQTVLALRELRVGADWRWSSDLRRRWELRAESWVEWKRDGDGDYYDRNRYYGRIEAHWRMGEWHLESGVTAFYLDYAARQLNTVNQRPQWQFKYGVDVRLERSFREHWMIVTRLFANRLESNRDALNYNNEGIEAFLSRRF